MTLTKIIVACVIQLLITCFGYQYLVHREEGVCNWKQFFVPKFEIRTAILLAASCVLSILAFWYSGIRCGDGFMRALLNAMTLNYLTIVGYIDLREKIIPNGLIGIGLLGWVILALLDIFVAKTAWTSVLKFSLIGGGLVGGVLLVLSLILKSALGMGDVKLFFVLGLLYGVADTYSILLFSVIIMAIISLILLATKKVTLKTAVPMAPFVVLGFILCILAGM